MVPYPLPLSQMLMTRPVFLATRRLSSLMWRLPNKFIYFVKWVLGLGSLLQTGHVRDAIQIKCSLQVWTRDLELQRTCHMGNRIGILGWFAKGMVLELVNTFSLHSCSLILPQARISYYTFLILLIRMSIYSCFIIKRVLDAITSIHLCWDSW